MASKKLEFFRMETDAQGITVVTFDRPPVNAVSFDVYPEIRTGGGHRVDRRDPGGRPDRPAGEPGLVWRRRRAELPPA